MEKLNSETEKRIKKSTRWPPAPAPSSWPTPAPAPTSWPSPAPAPVWTPKPTPGHAHFGPPKPLKRIKEPSSWPSPAPATLWTPNPKLNKAPAPAPEAGAEAKPTPGHAHFGPKPGIGHAPATAPEAGAEAKPTSACAPASATPGSVNRVRIFKSGIEKMFWVRVTSGICIIYLTNWTYIAPVTSAEWTLRNHTFDCQMYFPNQSFFQKGAPQNRMAKR